MSTLYSPIASVTEVQIFMSLSTLPLFLTLHCLALNCEISTFFLSGPFPVDWASYFQDSFFYSSIISACLKSGFQYTMPAMLYFSICPRLALDNVFRLPTDKAGIPRLSRSDDVTEFSQNIGFIDSFLVVQFYVYYFAKRYCFKGNVLSVGWQ